MTEGQDEQCPQVRLSKASLSLKGEAKQASLSLRGGTGEGLPANTTQG